MPGFLVHLGATVTCMHGGQAMPTMPNPRVRVAGQPAVTAVAPYTVAACPFVSPAPGPCVTAQWITMALRIRIQGQPAVLQDSQAICAPTGTGLLVLLTQLRVRGQ